jgi:PAS domain S-box-containing protein
MVIVSPTLPDRQEAGVSLQDPDTAQAAALRALLRGTSHVIVLIDADGTLGWASPSVGPVLGYEPAELVGTNVLTLLHPDDLELATELLSWSTTVEMDGGLDRDDARTAMDLRLRHRDGRWVNIEALTNNLLATEGIHAHLAIGRDVTARRVFDDALTALAEGISFEEGVLHLLGFLDLRISGSASALWWPTNRPEWTTSKVPSPLLRPRGPWCELPASGPYVIVDDVEEAARQGQIDAELGRAALDLGFRACWSVPVPRRSGSDIWGAARAARHASVSGALVVWSRFELVPLFGHTFPIDRVAALAHFAMARRQLELDREAQLVRERQETERLAKLDALRTDLVLSVSHDLRSPLTAITNAVDLLRDPEAGDDPADRASYADIISRNSRRLLRLVDDLLFLSSMDSDELPIDVTSIDVAELVAAAGADAVLEAKGKSLAVEVDVTPGPRLRGDAHRVRQLVDNLVSNALKYTGPGGHVRLAAAPAGAGWRVTVTDDGIGIPAAEQQLIFDRFRRASNVRGQQTQGSGLGLVIAQAVAALHHGGIGVQSEVGWGSTFSATLYDR